MNPLIRVASDEKVLSTVKHATTVCNGYIVYEFALDRIFVREYTSTGGILFGIAWNGQIHLDLTPLLGPYAGEYQTAFRQTSCKPGLGRHEVLKTDRVVVEKWGTCATCRAELTAPALIPPGVSIDEIK